MRTKRVILASALAIGLACLGGVAAADAPPAPVSSNLVVGTLAGPTQAQQDGVKLKTHGDMTVRTFTLTYPVGSDSGWHSHLGIVIAVVKSGTVVRRVGCRTEIFSAGQSFTEVEPHDVSNFYSRPGPGAVDAVLSITHIFPGGPTRNEEPPPTCPPHH